MTEPAATEPATSEPPTKKQRSDGTEPALTSNAEGTAEWKDLTLNINDCVTKDAAGKSFHELAAMSVQILQGLSGLKEEITACLDVHTVEDLADYKFARYAEAIATLALSEVEGKRPETSSMNVGLAVKSDYAKKSLREIAKGPVSALLGISEAACSLLSKIGVETVQDLAEWKLVKLARSIVVLARLEHEKVAAEKA